ncbi:AMP-binding protein [Prosthecomicrobium sp. N25]|uniref:AMP-binding protein n=1 Tax=Prosthecomicrobium sp. N25 TaxID=3129254 RepID=UPI0030780F72
MTDASTRPHLAPIDGLSHVRGETEPPLWLKTIPDVLAETVERFATREAVVFPEHGVRWTWEAFGARVEAVAAGFAALGLRKGDRIGIWSPNRPEWVLTQFASARAGLILVTINPAYRFAELEYVLNKVGAKALVAAERFKSSDYLEMIRRLAPELDTAKPGNLHAAKLPELRTVIRTGPGSSPGMVDFDAIAGLGGAHERIYLDAMAQAMRPEDPINIQFTSGTTGAPKGATLSHVNVVNNGRFTVGRMNFTHEDRLCIPVPLYHCFGMVMGTLGCASTGATMVFPGEGFDARATLSAIATERCTAVYGVPTMFSGMLDHPEFERFDVASLRTGIMAGAPCPIELMKRAVAGMGLSEITIAYGMTETSPVSFQSHTDDSLERRVTTVGRVHPHVEVKIVDPGTGETVPVGQSGELLTRGYSVMLGYWDDEANTRAAIDDHGFMHTGDLATIDAEGYGNIVGRVKDMIIRGGENVYPREIEEFLYRHPAVQTVQVFGVPDARYGEELCCWIVTRPGQSATAEEIRDFCRGQIAHYKVPRYVEFVTEIPMTVTGKAQKFRMREAMMERLGLSELKTA